MSIRQRLYDIQSPCTRKLIILVYYPARYITLLFDFIWFFLSGILACLAFAVSWITGVFTVFVLAMCAPWIGNDHVNRVSGRLDTFTHWLNMCACGGADQKVPSVQLAYFKDELEYVWRVSDMVETLERFIPNDLVREVIDFDEDLSRFTIIERERQHVKDRRMRAYDAVFVHSREKKQQAANEIEAAGKKKDFADAPLEEVCIEMTDTGHVASSHVAPSPADAPSSAQE